MQIVSGTGLNNVPRECCSLRSQGKLQQAVTKFTYVYTVFFCFQKLQERCLRGDLHMTHRDAVLGGI